MVDTEDVLERHLDAFGQQDLPEVMANYTDESVVVTNMGTFRGRNGIRRLFADLFEDFSHGGTLEIHQQTVEDDFAYVVWGGETTENVYEFATETFYIPEDGILFQTFAAKITTKE